MGSISSTENLFRAKKTSGGDQSIEHSVWASPNPGALARHERRFGKATRRLKLFVGLRLGYVNLHAYVNQLCAQASGVWFFLWNDDVLMQTVGWDEVVRSFTGQFVLLNPESNHGNQGRGDCPFPILPRRWFELLGHVALNNHYDTWVQTVSNGLEIRRDIPVHVLHDRYDLTGSNDDSTARERVFTTARFFSDEVQKLVLKDIDRLQQEFNGVLRSWHQ